jgi:hypothetical protein
MNVVQPLLQFQSQLKTWHWMTKSFAQHNAFGDAYEAISDKIDDFVEVYFGRYGREALAGVTLSIRALIDEATVTSLLNEFRLYLTGMDREIKSATDLLAIRDDILGEVNHLAYRLTLA